MMGFSLWLLLAILGALIPASASAQYVERVFSRVQQERQPYLDTLRELVSIESGSGDLEGLNLIADHDLNDPRDARVQLAKRHLTLQTLDSPVKFLAIASKVFARAPAPEGRPSIVIREQERGTVSSTLISLGKKPRDAIFQYASGAPDKHRYEDFSPLLRDILSRGLREAKTANANV